RVEAEPDVLGVGGDEIDHADDADGEEDGEGDRALGMRRLLAEIGRRFEADEDQDSVEDTEEDPRPSGTTRAGKERLDRVPVNAPLGDDVDEEPQEDGGGHQHQGQLDARGDPNAEVEEPEEQDRPEDAP